MRNSPENSSNLRNSADSLESADSVRRDENKPPSQQSNFTEKQLKEQRVVETQEHKKADIDLMNELSSLNVSTDNEENIEDRNTDTIEELSTEDLIKNYKAELTNQGKSQTKILNLLIARFKNKESVSAWVNNWKNFLRLHQFAESKPPKERNAIQNIIAKADFSHANAFNTSLTEIGKSTDISRETKFELSKEFGTNIMSVDGLDNTLKEVKEHKGKIEKAISSKSAQKQKLDSKIESLENDLEKLPIDSPKRNELESQIEQKKQELENTESAISELEKNKPKEVSFELRKGISAKLNPDGSRSIRLDNEDFSIKMPSHFLPLTTTRNLRSINMTFPYAILKKHKIAHLIFPNMTNNSIPSKENRKMGHLILSSLGIDDTKILSEEKINQLEKSLKIFDFDNGNTVLENLISLGIYNVQSQSMDKAVLKKLLNNTKVVSA